VVLGCDPTIHQKANELYFWEFNSPLNDLNSANTEVRLPANTYEYYTTLILKLILQWQ